eukprot:16415-Heterococcus_DN1.PRE.2
MLEAGSKQRSGETAVSIPVIVSLVMCNSKVNVFACTALSVNMLTSDAALAHTSCCIHCPPEAAAAAPTPPAAAAVPEPESAPVAADNNTTTAPPATTAAAAATTSAHYEVVSYYRALGVCLQTRKYSFITSLEDFAKYFDCLSDVAYIALDQSQYLKVNLTSSSLDHLAVPAVLRDDPTGPQPITWIDVSLMILIVVMMGAGCQGALWRAKIPQLYRHMFMRFTHCTVPAALRQSARGTDLNCVIATYSLLSLLTYACTALSMLQPQLVEHLQHMRLQSQGSSTVTGGSSSSAARRAVQRPSLLPLQQSALLQSIALATATDDDDSVNTNTELWNSKCIAVVMPRLACGTETYVVMTKKHMSATVFYYLKYARENYYYVVTGRIA